VPVLRRESGEPTNAQSAEPAGQKTTHTNTNTNN
jgi:hypothetical protein